MDISIILFAILAYLLGSIPFAVWVSKGFHGIDVRDYGSGNAGATNVFRVLGKKWGTMVLLLDVFKGFTAANLAHFLTNELVINNFILFQIIFGMLAVTGHLFPIFAQFRGGKGIATLLGMVFGLHYLLALGCMGVFILVLLTTGIVSISSIISTMMFGIFAYAIFGFSEPVIIFFGIFAMFLVLYTHRANIKRIWYGEEKKIRLKKPAETEGTN